MESASESVGGPSEEKISLATDNNGTTPVLPPESGETCSSGDKNQNDKNTEDVVVEADNTESSCCADEECLSSDTTENPTVEKLKPCCLSGACKSFVPDIQNYTIQAEKTEPCCSKGKCSSTANQGAPKPVAKANACCSDNKCSSNKDSKPVQKTKSCCSDDKCSSNKDSKPVEITKSCCSDDKCSSNEDSKPVKKTKSCCSDAKCSSNKDSKPAEKTKSCCSDDNCSNEKPSFTEQTMGKETERSTFHVDKICCASEIPAINSIVEPLKGVNHVAINVTAKLVYVDHDTKIVTATEICDALNQMNFGATTKRDAGNLSSSVFYRSTLSCEEGTLELDALENLLKTYDTSNLQSFTIESQTRSIVVVHNPLELTARSIAAFLEEQIQVKVTVLSDGGWNFSQNKELENEKKPDQEKIVLPEIHVILSGVFWVISMLSFIGDKLEFLKYVALLSVTFGLPGISRKAFSTVKRGQLDANCLMMLATTGALALQEFTEAAAVAFLFSLSEWLEVRATTRARSALSAIVKLRPEVANVVHKETKEIIMVPASAVPIGALISVKPGDKIPCDGFVVEGVSTIDESSLTGESRPVQKAPKDTVSGGTINTGATHFTMQATSTAENSAVSRLIRLVEEAQANRSETEKLVDEIAKFYTPLVFISAILMCTIPWFVGPETGRKWTNHGLVLIVVACPCALIISTPVTYVAGLAATAQRGIVIKGGAHLEALGLVKTICFDKTGTLTQGSYALLQAIVIGEKYTRNQVLEYLMLMEEKATHPLAIALLDGARNEGCKIPTNMSLKNHKFLPGEGLSGDIDGLEVLVGNQRLFKRRGLFDTLSDELKRSVANWETMAGTVGFMSIEGDGIVCAFCAADAVRPESIEVIESLRKLDIEMHMLTGDNQGAARAIGAVLGLKEECIKSELLPEEKLELLRSLQEGVEQKSILSSPFAKRNLVLMVGDGVNDAPALACANVGVAMGVGAALAMETADVTLLDSNLKKLVYSIQMGRKVIWKIKENVAFSILVKLAVFVLTFYGLVGLWAAIATDLGAMIIVTLNGMRLLPPRKIKQERMGNIENVSYTSRTSGGSLFDM